MLNLKNRLKGPEHSGLFLNRFNANRDIHIVIDRMSCAS